MGCSVFGGDLRVVFIRLYGAPAFTLGVLLGGAKAPSTGVMASSPLGNTVADVEHSDLLGFESAADLPFPTNPHPHA